ncbi:hypothetical protein AVEN_159890-1 [Araneus ventricosus]|uniref:Helitron helicase-like domain-containing protein n=1 Tax=Araneus ventricosus TaxID=182803 RepID=A0A4Y2E2A2_ARAVE|nr:hypothetical protein AVEN_159890-1 [Araneus ventricosus]
MMTEICNFCQALYWRNELNSSNKYTKCCHDGKARLPNLADTPDLLKELLTNNSLEARNYQQHIREYNAALAFASMGGHKSTSWRWSILLSNPRSDLPQDCSTVF